MGRYARDKSLQNPKPVERIELSEKNVGIRIAVVAVLILIAISSFGYGISQLLSVDSGWTEIEADSAADINLGNEFVLMYELGARDDMTVVEENKGIRALYTEVMVDAYQSFYDNLYYINQHPNEAIQVDELLYQAFELLNSHDNRIIYLAPIYEQYNNLFTCEVDAETKDFDPYQNEALATEFKLLASYAQDATKVRIELLGNNTIQLIVAEEYLQFANENGITSYIDFAWMKNAFIVDYLAEVLLENGYQAATISSYDGFLCNLDDRGTEFSYNLYDWENGNVIQAGKTTYSSGRSIVAMYAFPINTLDTYRYYVFDNGEIRSSYLSVFDGLCKSTANSVYASSETYSCAETMLSIQSLYINDSVNLELWSDLKAFAIQTIVVKDKTIYYTEEDASITDVYSSYQTELMN